ncbi:PREDICTED: CKLF-like MARVEL transmembrane domain-containing protein 2 [Chinchilla lanigera]|uniref:CKLF-like MARVEL transmembrane domain-containing protein 2 n=1 Tax=Chinchilla lanigera TaxID=34839 RepID=UPI00038EA773|nr:PREDICTED: CKLF-like MARVEL transmembrane domain-containing protein 2 [Chinchilla lanigera]
MADKASSAPGEGNQPSDEVGTRKGCRRYRWELKDSNKEFWVLWHGLVKFLSLGCMITAQLLFQSVPKVHPFLALILTMEISILCFLIILYTFAIQRYLPFILWPVTDLLNDLVACAFLGGGAYFAVEKQPNMPLNYLLAVIFMGLAAVFYLIDACLQRKHFKGKKLRKNMMAPPAKGDDGAGKGKGKK